MTEPHMQDALLKKALTHAPDQDVQPDAITRNHILNYAIDATKARRTWLSQLKNWLFNDHVANAHWAGLTGLAAVLLVSLLLWREHPEDLVGISDTPATISESTEISEKKADFAPAATSPAAAEIAPDQAITESKEQITMQTTAPTSAPVAENTPAEKPAKAIIIGRAEMVDNSQLKMANKVESKKLATVETDQIKPAALEKNSKETFSQSGATSPELKTQQASEEVALAQAEPAPAEAPAPRSVPIKASDTDNATNINKDKANTIERNQSRAKVEGHTVGGNMGEASLDDQRRKISVDHKALASLILQNGGQAIAKQDIQAGIYRLFKVIAHQENKTDCDAPETHAEKIDERSGLPIQHIDVCIASAQLLKEVDIYNKAVLDWYLQYQGE